MSSILRELAITYAFFQFGMLETCTSGFIDEFPKYLRNHRTLFTAGVCVFQCVLGIPFVTQVSHKKQPMIEYFVRLMQYFKGIKIV